MTTFAHSLAVLIGIDAYTGGIPRLTTAVNDATRLTRLLAAQHGYETILLTEPAAGEPVNPGAGAGGVTRPSGQPNRRRPNFDK